MATTPTTARDPDAVAQARAAKLRYVNDDEPGIARRGTDPKRFRYFGHDGREIRSPEILARIRRLAIPPAWTDVWICPDPAGHIQATGRDEKGRKQYRYHPRWQEIRDQTKYARMIAFARALPKIRRRIDADLARPGLPREKVEAAVVRLLERTLIRIGNDEYARSNGSYGLTTLQDQHAKVRGRTIEFAFRAKSGKFHKIDLEGSRLAKIVRACQDLPGQELFQYRDEQGHVRDITSSDVNAYLRAITGEDFTAKDFRTWAATVMAALALKDQALPSAKVARNRMVNAAIDRVAAALGNTRAVARKSYVHPQVFDAFSDGTLAKALAGACRPVKGLDRDEVAVLEFLCAGAKSGRKASSPVTAKTSARARRHRDTSKTTAPRYGSRSTRSQPAPSPR
jgi:DNA topoisomerase-1